MNRKHREGVLDLLCGKNLLFVVEPDQWFLKALCIGLPQEVFSEDGKTYTKALQ